MCSFLHPTVLSDLNGPRPCVGDVERAWICWQLLISQTLFPSLVACKLARVLHRLWRAICPLQQMYWTILKSKQCIQNASVERTDVIWNLHSRFYQCRILTNLTPNSHILCRYAMPLQVVYFYINVPKIIQQFSTFTYMLLSLTDLVERSIKQHLNTTGH